MIPRLTGGSDPPSAFALTFALALALLAPGCADLAGHAPTLVERCRASTALLFREDAATGERNAPAPASRSFSTLLSGGIWTRVTFRVAPENGTGNWSAPASALHNITLEDARVDFERGISSKSLHDVKVSYAQRRTLSDAEFAGFCAAVANDLPTVPATDEGTGCGALGVTAVWRAWLDGNEFDRTASCGDSAPATRAFVAAIEALKAGDPPQG